MSRDRPCREVLYCGPQNDGILLHFSQKQLPREMESRLVIIMCAGYIFWQLFLRRLYIFLSSVTNASQRKGRAFLKLIFGVSLFKFYMLLNIHVTKFYMLLNIHVTKFYMLLNIHVTKFYMLLNIHVTKFYMLQKLGNSCRLLS